MCIFPLELVARASQHPPYHASLTQPCEIASAFHRVLTRRFRLRVDFFTFWFRDGIGNGSGLTVVGSEAGFVMGQRRTQAGVAASCHPREALHRRRARLRPIPN